MLVLANKRHRGVIQGRTIGDHQHRHGSHAGWQAGIITDKADAGTEIIQAVRQGKEVVIKKAPAHAQLIKITDHGGLETI